MDQSEWKTFSLHPTANPSVVPYAKLSFLNENLQLKEISFIDEHKEIFYAVTYEHSRIEG